MTRTCVCNFVASRCQHDDVAACLPGSGRCTRSKHGTTALKQQAVVMALARMALAFSQKAKSCSTLIMQPSASVAKLAKIQKGRACGRAAGTRVGRPPKCTEIGWIIAPGRSTQRGGMNTELVILPKNTGDKRVVFRVQEAINASHFPSVLAMGVPVMRNDMSFT